MISFYSQEVDHGGKLKKNSDVELSEGFYFAKIRSCKLLITLGHTNVKTTRLYAWITDTKVSNDMDVLQENLQSIFDKPLAQSIKSRKKIAQADEVAQLAKKLGVAL